MTNKTGQWLCSEDKKLYEIRIQSGGKTGYATAKLACKSTIHPSKRRKFCKPNDALEQKQSCNFSENSSDTEGSQSSSDEMETDEAETTQSSTSEGPDQGIQQKCSQQSTSSAVLLVRAGKLPVRRAAAVSKILHESGIEIATPSQSGVYKAVYREASTVREILKQTLHKANGACTLMVRYTRRKNIKQRY